MKLQGPLKRNGSTYANAHIERATIFGKKMTQNDLDLADRSWHSFGDGTYAGRAWFELDEARAQTTKKSLTYTIPQYESEDALGNVKTRKNVKVVIYFTDTGWKKVEKALLRGTHLSKRKASKTRRRASKKA